MSTAGITAPAHMPQWSSGPWIYNRRWDLSFLSLSVFLVPIPYLVWLLLRDGFNVDGDLSRQIVNLCVIVAVAGPHTYATFSRTMFDDQFREKHRAYYLSSFAIPLIVIVLALANLALLLTLFFFWASLHTLHQIVFIIDAYNEKESYSQHALFKPRLSQLIDYGPVLVALYPVAAYRIAITQDFAVGPTSINEMIPSFFEQPWLAYLAIALFIIAIIAFSIKTAFDIRAGRVNKAKVVFISMTVVAFFFIPMLDNLDTALQGINVWHCTQYLGLTWYINRLREERGELEKMPLIKRISEPDHARSFYLFNLLLTVGSLLLMAVFFIILLYGAGGKWADPSYAFETAYYIGILAFLWIHYYQDHFLFTEPEAVLP